MLLFDIHKLESLSCNDPKLLLEILHRHLDKTAKVSKKVEVLCFTTSLIGTSYLLNPWDLFNDQSIDELFKVQYIKLAGRRDLALYKYNGYKGLQLSYYPELSMDAIKYNPLLDIKQHEILFKLEERNTYGTRIQQYKRQGSKKGARRF